MSQRLTGKVTIVTGACKGIGAAMLVLGTCLGLAGCARVPGSARWLHQSRSR